jgi:hypothetical protein
MQPDWNTVVGEAAIVLSLAATPLVLLAIALRKQRLRSQPPGSLTIDEVKAGLHASGISHADKRELAARFSGQRVRWACTFRELFTTKGSTSVLCTGLRGGQFFFDPARADAKRLEQTAEGTLLVAEGTVRVDLDHDLLTLDAPVVRFDLKP